MQDHYSTLKIAPDAPEEVVQAAYRSLSKKFHPDNNKGQSDDSMKAINEAYAVLRDEKRRAGYDLSLATERIRRRRAQEEAAGAFDEQGRRFAQEFMREEREDIERRVREHLARSRSTPPPHEPLTEEDKRLIMATALTLWGGATLVILVTDGVGWFGIANAVAIVCCARLSFVADRLSFFGRKLQQARVWIERKFGVWS